MIGYIAILFTKAQLAYLVLHRHTMGRPTNHHQGATFALSLALLIWAVVVVANGSAFSPPSPQYYSAAANAVSAAQTTTTTAMPTRSISSTTTANKNNMKSSTTSEPVKLRLYSNNDTPASLEQNQQECLDATALLKYAAAIVVQMSLISLVLAGMDQVVSRCSFLLGLNNKVPFAANCFLFYALALKSRIFNPLANTRPQPQSLEIKNTITSDTNNTSNANPTLKKRIMPRWTPPGVVFPIVWLLIIGPIRAVASAMVYQSVPQKYLSLPILSLMLHLSIGDVWNTINNVERRLGVAVLGVYTVWLSKAHAVYQYTAVNPVAGRLLGLTLIWLTIASALVTATWRLNPDPATGRPEPLVPVVKKDGRSKSLTQFAWFSNGGKPNESLS